MISTRGRYAIRVMLDLAECRNGEYVPMRQVAEQQEISLKYIEKIMPLLTRHGLVEGLHGKGGGYRLRRSPDEYTVGEILRAADEELAPVACLECGASPCEQASGCRTLPMWTEFYKLATDYFNSITLADLMKGGGADNYSI